MLRILIIALLISIPAFAQDAAKPPTIIVQPAPVIVREIPPAQVSVGSVPQPLRIQQPDANFFEQYQSLTGVLLTVVVTVIGWRVVLRQTGEQVKAGRQQTQEQIEASRQQTERQIRAAHDQTTRQLEAASQAEQRRQSEHAKQVAAAIAGEMYAFKIFLIEMSVSKSCRYIASALSNGQSIPHYQAPSRGIEFSIFRNAGQEIGRLPVFIVRRIPSVYALMISLDAQLEQKDQLLAQGDKAPGLFMMLANTADYCTSVVEIVVSALDFFSNDRIDEARSEISKLDHLGAEPVRPPR